MMDTNSEVVYIDGSCHDINGDIICSVGIYWARDDVRNSSYRVLCSTNNQAELLAAYVAIRQAINLGITNLVIKTDSQYVQQIFSKWINTWRLNGWVSAKKRPVKNKQIICEIEKMLALVRVSFHWMRGHDSANIGNRGAHELAEKAVRDPVAIQYNLEFEID